MGRRSYWGNSDPKSPPQKEEREKNADQFIQDFDFSNAIDTLGGDLEFFHSLTNDYINIYGNADEAFTNFLKAQDIEQAERLVHNIAGLSATFVQELGNLAAAIKEFHERYKPET